MYPWPQSGFELWPGPDCQSCCSSPTVPWILVPVDIFSVLYFVVVDSITDNICKKCSKDLVLLQIWTLQTSSSQASFLPFTLVLLGLCAYIFAFEIFLRFVVSWLYSSDACAWATEFYSLIIVANLTYRPLPLLVHHVQLRVSPTSSSGSHLAWKSFCLWFTSKWCHRGNRAPSWH